MLLSVAGKDLSSFLELLQRLLYSGDRSDDHSGRMLPPMCLRSPKENTHPSLGFCCSQTHMYLLSWSSFLGQNNLLLHINVYLLNLSFCISTLLEYIYEQSKGFLCISRNQKPKEKDQMLDGHHDAFDTWWILMLAGVVLPILICIFLARPLPLLLKMLIRKGNSLH